MISFMMIALGVNVLAAVGIALTPLFLEIKGVLKKKKKDDIIDLTKKKPSIVFYEDPVSALTTSGGTPVTSTLTRNNFNFDSTLIRLRVQRTLDPKFLT